jgi:hypothetical protein
MSSLESTQPEDARLHHFRMMVDVFGPIRPSHELHRHTQRAIKSHNSGRDFFTDITLHDSRSGGMRVEYTVTANSPSTAERAGAVYLSQLCDLLSVVTRSPVWFYMPDEDVRDERMRLHRRASTVDRILTEEEWSWITGNLVFLRRQHPRFLAAASWYRKGLIGRDSLEDFCCFWRVIERLGYSYASKSDWSKEKKAKSNVKDCVQQLTHDLFSDSSAPNILRDQKMVSDIIQLRNDLSHGNIPITLEVIDAATSRLKPLEHAAFLVLHGIRQNCLKCQVP